jgi:hypothetical protein
MAAPRTPNRNMNISNGSKMIFVTSPITADKLQKLLNAVERISFRIDM